MSRSPVIVLAALFVAAIFAVIVPMWVATAGMGLPPAGWAAVIGTVIFCFGLGGALMFLIFYSARKGHDEAGQMHGQEHRRDP